jgi:CHAT domain-containing protein
LKDKAKLRPNDFVGKTQNHLRRDRPFVFLNACRVGQAGHSLTGLGGWGKTLVQDAHAAGLIAPLWSVSDQAAQLFAETFYQHCAQPGMTLGEAIRQARLKVRQSAPDDPTWLAYSLYAHPNARIPFKAAVKP